MSALSYLTSYVRGASSTSRTRRAVTALGHRRRVRLLRDFNRCVPILGGACATATAQDQSGQPRAQQHQRGDLRRTDVAGPWIPWIIDLDDTPVGQPVRTIVRHVVPAASWVDRKSTRLNSSHTVISYAVFCLKKKKKNQTQQYTVNTK